MAKQSGSFRLPPETTERLIELAAIFRDSRSEVLERAVNLLYEQREEVLKKEMNERLQLAKPKK